jgi:uncharacterized Zn finger protein
VSRETVSEKASRLLTEGRVHVQRADGTRIAATVQGDHGRYVIVLDGERWACSCPSFRACSHIAAVELVATPSPELVSGRAREAVAA